MNKLAYILLSISIVLTTGCSLTKTTSSHSEYLFSIDGEKHFTDEFNYAFAKNNQESRTSEDSINNYLDLYINFRLKVASAKSAGYDTTTSFKKEFHQYKEQLDESYLSPKKEMEALIKQAYDRMQWEIKAAHILISVTPGAAPEDTLKAYQKCMSIRDKIVSGENFNKMAMQLSDDPSAKTNGGELGYFTALQMVYPFENAAYNTPVGEISEPIRTKFGYHIIKIEDKRENIGKVQVAHIMILSTEKNNEGFRKAAREKIFMIDSLLQNGGEWNAICKKYSEDKNSAFNNGLLSPFSKGQIVPEFENAAFALEKIGDISSPIQTRFGWHIIKLVKKIPVGSYEEEHDNLARRIRSDSRSSMPHDEMIKTLKAKNGYRENEQAINKIYDLSKTSLTKGKWVFTNEAQNDSTWLFRLGDKSVSLGDFLSTMNNKHVENNVSKMEAIDMALSTYADTLVTNYEKLHLADSYPDYNYLLDEYYDGILLFSIMEDSVWSKSMDDSVGLALYYKKHLDRYTNTVKDSTLFTSSSESILKEVLLKSLKEDDNWDKLKTKLLEEYNISPLNLHVVPKKDSIWREIRSNPDLDASEPFELNKQWYWLHFEDTFVLQPLNNVKGKVIADYQTYLDKKWIGRLKERYPIEINKKQLKVVYEHFKADN